MSSGDAGDSLFDRFYRRFGGLVYAVANSALRDAGEAQDAAQETWIRVYQALGQSGTDIEFPESWILTIARREAYRRRRRQRHRPLETDPPAGSAGEGPGLREALERIPVEERRLLRARYLEGRPLRHIARDLGLAESTVYRRLQQARDRLIAALRRSS